MDIDSNPLKKLKKYHFPIEISQDKLSIVSEELGREIRVFTNTFSSSTGPNETPPSIQDEGDDFYEFTPEDYFRLMGDKIGAQAQMLKTRKMREAEAAARRAKITKAIVRVRFPDNYILEAKFKPSEKIQDLVDLLKKVINRPDIPFYLYTTPPKERIKDNSKDLYSAGFAPGGIVYFSYDIPNDSELNNEDIKMGPYLSEEIQSLNGLETVPKQEKMNTIESESVPNMVPTNAPNVNPNPRPAAKKTTKPKWLKL